MTSIEFHHPNIEHEQPVASDAPPSVVAYPTQRAAPPQPAFCRVNGGQIFRALLLVVLCMGLAKLTGSSKAAPEPAVALDVQGR